MRVSVTAPRSELGVIVSEHSADLVAQGGDERVVINVALQAPNSLLHDGQAWKRYPPQRLLEDTRAALRSSRRATFLVHASYLFAGADDAGLEPGRALRPLIDAALEAESLVLGGTTPACVVRLAYLYGPASRNLRAYRRAFRLGRPYWAGPGGVRQRFLHSSDAADALLAAAAQRSAGRVLAAADNQPVSFATLMDHFARLVGNPLPLHLPSISAPISRLIIAPEHMQACQLRTAAIDAQPRPRGFAPHVASYKSGLRDTVDAWSAE